jgi:hypothetical protein
LAPPHDPAVEETFISRVVAAYEMAEDGQITVAERSAMVTNLVVEHVRSAQMRFLAGSN